MINEKLDFYVMEASDEEFDTEEVRKLVKRLDELDPIPLPWKSDEEALKDFWDYCEERHDAYRKHRKKPAPDSAGFFFDQR